RLGAREPARRQCRRALRAIGRRRGDGGRDEHLPVAQRHRTRRLRDTTGLVRPRRGAALMHSATDTLARLAAFVIVDATPGDAPALAELAARTFHDSFAADNTPED